MFCTRKTEPLNVFSWKFENSCRKPASVRVQSRPSYLAPISNASTVSCANWSLAGSMVLTLKVTGFDSAERSRLKPPAL